MTENGELLKGSTGEGLRAVLEAGALNAAVKPPLAAGGAAFAVLPERCAVKDLEHLLPAPTRKRGCPVFKQERGFSAYVNDHKDKASRVFADAERLDMTAVLDLHTAGEARWGEHKALFAPPLDPDFTAWRGNDEKAMGQTDFAQFIEDMLPTIARPDGAELLEVAQHLEAKTKVTFKSAQRLSDGRRQFVYSEDTEGKVGKGHIEVPGEFVLRLPVFARGDAVEIVAKLRYRIAEGKLVFWYRLHRLHAAVDGAFQRLIDGVEVATKIDVWIGAPSREAAWDPVKGRPH